MTRADIGPILFLDDDRVILDRRRPGDREPMNSAIVGTVQVHNPMLRDPIQIFYSRPAVDFINQMATSCEVQWLTGLGEWVPKVLAPALGLGHFDSAFQYGFEADADSDPIGDGSRWWKNMVVRAAAEVTRRRFAWVDDQITSGVMRRMTADTVRTLLVPLERRTAMQAPHFERIANFVETRHDNR